MSGGSPRVRSTRRPAVPALALSLALAGAAACDRAPARAPGAAAD